MEHSYQKLNSESDEDKITTCIAKLSLHPQIDTISKENKKRSFTEIYNLYTKKKECFLKNAKELNKISSIIKRKKRQVVTWKEYDKLFENSPCGRNSFNKILIFLPKEIDILKTLTCYCVKEISKLTISIESCCDSKEEDIEEFLLSFCCTKVKEFEFYGYSTEIKNKNYDLEDEDSFKPFFKVYPCSKIFLGLREVVSRITSCIYIVKLNINSNEFSKLVIGSKHAKKLSFVSCKILTFYEFNFGEMNSCAIEEFKIGYYFGQVYEDLCDYEQSLMRILIAILHCSNLTCSLNKLTFRCSDAMKIKLFKKAKEILKEKYDKLMPSLENNFDD